MHSAVASHAPDKIPHAHSRRRTETARLSAVVNNSVFRTNPLAAIATHLEATLLPPPPAPRKQLTKAQKRKARKASVQSNVVQ